MFYLFTCFVYWIFTFFNHHPIGSPIDASAYHWTYPFYFISLFAIILFLNFVLFKRLLFRFFKVKPYLFYMLFYSIWILISTIFSGALWSYFDMKAGYFPEFSLLFQKLIQDMFYGLTWGIFLIGCAFPFNIIVLIFSFFVIRRVKKIEYDNILN
ncbi:hypothetical protein [Flavobacterium sp.]|uniref:hypothetical protein n=1 Tax=Flavobacterium sp. TaxID=239 RepID=UPI00286AE958|nr:hypothetical protein [Flavobacterium sp.]